MTSRATRHHPPQPGARRAPGEDDQTGEPPRLEVPERGGTYVLLDVGPRADWRYLWAP